MHELLLLINYSLGPYYTTFLLTTSNYAKITYHGIKKKAIYSISGGYPEFKKIFLPLTPSWQHKYDSTESSPNIAYVLIQKSYMIKLYA